MNDRFPLAYSTLGCPEWTFEHAVSQAAQSGYKALEVRVLDGEIIPSDLPESRRYEMKRVLADHNMEIIGLGLSTRFSSPDPEVRRANQVELIRYIQLANDLQVPIVRTFGGNTEEGETVDDAVNWVAEALNGVTDASAQYGVKVALETHDAFCRGAEVARVLEQVPDSQIGAVWDVHHPFRMGEPIQETWNLIGQRVLHVHMKDARLQPDGTWQLVLMGEGEVPCHDIVRLLDREGYEGYVCAEWEKKWHPEIEEPEVALPQHAAVLRQWYAEL